MDHWFVRRSRLSNFSGLKFLGVSDHIDGCAGRAVGQATVRRFHHWLHLQFFSLKLVFFWVYFGYGVLHGQSRIATGVLDLSEVLYKPLHIIHRINRVNSSAELKIA